MVRDGDSFRIAEVDTKPYHAKSQKVEYRKAHRAFSMSFQNEVTMVNRQPVQLVELAVLQSAETGVAETAMPASIKTRAAAASR